MKMSPIRPQILGAITFLTFLAAFSLWKLETDTIAIGAVTGIVALAKDIISSDSGD